MRPTLRVGCNSDFGSKSAGPKFALSLLQWFIVRSPLGHQRSPRSRIIQGLLTRIDCKFRRLYSFTGRLAMWFDLLVAALIYGAIKRLT